MERYSEYRDSGNYIIGDIPSSWTIIKLKHLCDGFNNGTSALQTEQGANTVKVSRIETISKGVVDYSKTGNIEYSDNIEKYRLNKGDILFSHINSYDRVGSIAVFDGEQTLFHGMNLLRLRPNGNCYNFFLYHYMKSLNFTLQVQRRCKPAINQVSVPTGIVKELLITLPPVSEQQAIVSYLDDKCAKIDKSVEGMEKQIVLLQEMKQRVIADAVTRGLDKNVEIDETGIFWWPQKPRHWKVMRLGHILQKHDRPRPEKSELLVCTNKGTVTKRGDSKMGLVADSEDIYQGVCSGDLLIHGMDTWHGAIAVSNYDGMCTPVVHVCTSKEDCNYIAYYMQVMAYSKIFKVISNGVRQNTSDFRSWNKVSVIPIPLPPIEEQRAIVTYINERTAKIETLKTKIQQEIGYLKEYKQRLISDVVTGQIKVC